MPLRLRDAPYRKAQRIDPGAMERAEFDAGVRSREDCPVGYGTLTTMTA
jgi:hypothetical protein